MTELLLVTFFVLLSPQHMQTWGENTTSPTSTPLFHHGPPSHTHTHPPTHFSTSTTATSATTTSSAVAAVRFITAATKLVPGPEEIGSPLITDKQQQQHGHSHNTSSGGWLPAHHLPSPAPSLSGSGSASSKHSTKPPPVQPRQPSLLLDPAAALLVHAHDTHANLRHHHHNSHSWGPHFEDTSGANVTVTEGDNVVLDCRVGLLEDKMVSWVRRKSDQLDLLTLGTTNYSSDPRVLSDFKYPNNWRLAIRNTSRSDSGMYLCQISTHPPKVFEVHLTVQAPQVFIVSSRGERITEVHYKEGSTLQLICTVNNIMSKSLNWYRNTDLLNHDVSRGGVSIKTDITSSVAKSVLRVAFVTRKDGGTYLCSAPPQNASVTVHVLNGENPAELYRNDGVGAMVMGSRSPADKWTYGLCIFLIWFAVSAAGVHAGTTSASPGPWSR